MLQTVQLYDTYTSLDGRRYDTRFHAAADRQTETLFDRWAITDRIDLRVGRGRPRSAQPLPPCTRSPKRDGALQNAMCRGLHCRPVFAKFRQFTPGKSRGRCVHAVVRFTTKASKEFDRGTIGENWSKGPPQLLHTNSTTLRINHPMSHGHNPLHNCTRDFVSSPLTRRLPSAACSLAFTQMAYTIVLQTCWRNSHRGRLSVGRSQACRQRNRCMLPTTSSFAASQAVWTTTHRTSISPRPSLSHRALARRERTVRVCIWRVASK